MKSAGIPQLWHLSGAARITVIALACAAVGLISVTLLRHSPRTLESRPDVGAAVATADLYQTSTRLRDSFTISGDRDSRQSTEEYLGYMRRMQQACSDIEQYASIAKRSSDTDATTQYLSKSNALCSDLMETIEESVATQTAALPILKVNSHLKRYQTLPLLRTTIRNRQEHDVAAGLQQLQRVTGSTGYPSQALPYLRQLRQAMDTNLGLSYYPALVTFQNNMSAERQRYWNNYGDLGNLINTLHTQLGRYCQNLPRQDSPPAECKYNYSE